MLLYAILKTPVMPGPEERIVSGDILHVLGTRAEIDACILMLKNTNSTNAPDAGPWKLKEYLHLQVLKKTAPEEQLICVPLKVDRRSILYKKPIKYSQFRQRYKGSIIGIERRSMDIVNPDISTVLEEDDIIWAVGGQMLADRLLKAGLWDMEMKKSK